MNDIPCPRCGGAISPANCKPTPRTCTCHTYTWFDVLNVRFGPHMYGPIVRTVAQAPSKADWERLVDDLKKNPPKLQLPPEPEQGWQCPVCKTVHAPFVRSCPQSHPK